MLRRFGVEIADQTMCGWMRQSRAARSVTTSIRCCSTSDSRAVLAVSLTLTILFDSISLIKSALHDEEYGWLKESATVAQCWRAAMLLVVMLEEVFLPGHPGQVEALADAGARQRWRARYIAALQRMREAGIKTIDDPVAGFETYASLRDRWDGHIARLRASMLYEAWKIDAPTYRPEVVCARPPFDRRLRDV